MALTLSEARTLLAEHGQEHVLRFWEQLDEPRQAGLLAQIEGLDFDRIRVMRVLLAAPQTDAVTGEVVPADVVRHADVDRPAARRSGEAAIAAGEVGVILVAGGQGSRLGYDGPKGCYPLAPVSNATLFEIHCRKILALERKHASRIPFYIMTSRANDEDTRAFFAANAFFGLSPDRVKFFVQGMWPALDGDGRLVLDRPDRLFMGPDGHGGTLSALKANGMLDDMAARGVTTLFYFQVDNPLVEIADPVFIGLHCGRSADMSVKVCAKRGPDEGLGVVVLRDGRSAVLEYSDPALTDEMKRATLAGGELTFRFGSVAIHVFSRDFLEREAAAELPLHIAHKKVPVCNETGRTIKPDEPNAFKFEKFIFDALPDAAEVLNLEFAREDEFSPVKNASGEDSPATARRDMVRKAARWLEACGTSVPVTEDGDPRYAIEIDPCYAVDAEELKEKLPPGFRVEEDVLLR